MSFGRERALYQLIGSRKAQIQILRDHIKKSNHRTYLSFLIKFIIKVSSNSEEKFKKFPVPLGWERPLYQFIGIKKAQVQTLRVHIEKSNRRTYFSSAINLIIRVSFNSEEKVRKFSPCGLDGLFFFLVCLYLLFLFCFVCLFILFVCFVHVFLFCFVLWSISSLGSRLTLKN